MTTTTTSSAPIVVGYDGSEESRWAVLWAADEAERTGAQLQIVNAYRIQWPGAYYVAVAEQTEAAREVAAQLVAEIAARMRERGTGLHVIGTVVDAPPAAALLEFDARLLVVGSRGAGGLTNLLMGSVSQQVATHARVPVAVVRGRSAATDGPVVVGADGSAAGEHALAAAFAAARSRATELVAIHAGPAGFEKAALEASLAPWRERYPDVKVEALVATGQAAAVLVGVSQTAQLVVVGSRGHGGFTGLLLGSVGQQLMHHAECPVLIARG